MYKNVLQSIENIAIWPVISFVIFFIFFLCLLLWVFTTDKKLIEKMKALPMEDASVENQTTTAKK
ncbi:cbb3-type cytochrome c oxidase subunit 3 [Chryseosolibacter indicus]|uniref:Cbb3-type cytochrome c oxidase subunit 3 n=1 Tax=Chryseosolibacter indicus TaxID=2782351 RepID=A0ABS5VRT9_9BACT|nr:cbb3-type cytochrome c oxidase subunit 3 [Chryseosolibacter indicus]MBT1703748.1 cbb3-type cytochrome c oxidase subunit 3 [Chryseosolibacter indicus]